MPTGTKMEMEMEIYPYISALFSNSHSSSIYGASGDSDISEDSFDLGSLYKNGFVPLPKQQPHIQPPHIPHTTTPSSPSSTFSRISSGPPAGKHLKHTGSLDPIPEIDTNRYKVNARRFISSLLDHAWNRELLARQFLNAIMCNPDIASVGASPPFRIIK